MTKDINFDMNENSIHELLRGKRIELRVDDIRVIIHPPNEGYFFTVAEFALLRRMLHGLPLSSKPMAEKLIDEKINDPTR